MAVYCFSLAYKIEGSRYPGLLLTMQGRQIPSILLFCCHWVVAIDSSHISRAIYQYPSSWEEESREAECKELHLKQVIQKLNASFALIVFWQEIGHMARLLHGRLENRAPS